MKHMKIVDIHKIHYIKGSYISQIEGMDDPKFGKSRTNSETFKIEISEHPKGLQVGKIIKRLMFQDYPDFYVNIIASSPIVNNNGISDFPNPQSHWFNVFYGFYEIDLPIHSFSSPFGFDSNNHVIPIEIIKFGLCDWNIITSYLYGVPYELCEENVKITGNEKMSVINDSIKIGKYFYKEIEFSDILVTSSYPAKSKLDTHSPIAKLLQKEWGIYNYIKGYDIPFPTVRMAGRFYITSMISYNHDINCFCYKTIVAGGVVNMNHPDPHFNQEFLNKQMQSIRQSILINDNYYNYA